MTTRFYLVRHAAHGLLGRVLAGRMPGVALSEVGREQAATLARRLGAEPIAAVLSSPVQRAMETAGPIAVGAGVPVQMEAGFEEIEFGRWTGAAFSTLDPAPEWQAWNAARGLAPTPGGETMLAAQARAVAALGRCREQHAGQTVVVVSHADIIKAVLMHVLGMPLEMIHRFEIAPASVSTLELGVAHAVVHGLNQLG